MHVHALLVPEFLTIVYSRLHSALHSQTCLSVIQGVVFVFGLLITVITFLVSCQCQRKGQLIFAASALTSLRNELQ